MNEQLNLEAAAVEAELVKARANDWAGAYRMPRPCRECYALAFGDLFPLEAYGYIPGSAAATAVEKPARRTSPRLNTTDLVAAVKAHALANYERGGWDYVVECYSDNEIAALLSPRIKTAAGAIKAVAKVVGAVDSVRRDVQGA